MKNKQEELNLSHTGDRSPAEQHAVMFPPKFEKNERENSIWLRSIISLALYLVLGYYIFHRFDMLLLITGIVLFHEMGHFLAMKAFRYKDLGIFFIPLLGAYVSGSKRDVSQKESAVILLAGPLPGIIIGIIIYILYLKNPALYLGGISYYTVSLSLIFLNLINLIPVYPLDGGQILNRVFLDENSLLSKIFVFLSIGFLCWIALFGMKPPFYPLLIFPLMMLFRMAGDSKITALEKKLEEEGFHLDISYEDMPDETYWKIRDVLLREHPAFRDIPATPPYEYCDKEEKIMHVIKGLLHRHLIQDLPWPGKVLILATWVTAFASPWLLHMDMSFFHRFGF